ncbi:MAG: hypothetical protein RJB66_1250 [Pseudomonadota bacterium]|jgi:membrane-bound lytic murein transglycosylase D
MALSISEKFKAYSLSFKVISFVGAGLFFLTLGFSTSSDSSSNLNHSLLQEEPSEAIKLSDQPNSASLMSSPFIIPEGFGERVDFWIKIYSQYTSNDAVFHDSQDLSVIYKVIDLRPIMDSALHPFVKEFKTKKLIERERKILIRDLLAIKTNWSSQSFTPAQQELLKALKYPQKKSFVSEAIKNLRMQIGQKTFIEKAINNADLYLPMMEQIFLKKGLPVELTRMPFVESSFNLAARSRVGASGIWQIMPATGRKLMPNKFVDYRNDPIKATEFAASLLKFNYKVLGDWPLAVTAYNHGPTSISKLTKKYGTKNLSTLTKRVYGSHAFAFASANFYACFLAILEIEKNRPKYFPDVPKVEPISLKTIQIKKPLRYTRLLSWFDRDALKAELYNPHLSGMIRSGRVEIPRGTIVYIPTNASQVAVQEQRPSLTEL